MKQTIMYETNQKAGCLLHANELPWNISEEMRQEIINAIATLEFQRYPDTECTQLIKTYCEVASLFEKQVLAGIVRTVDRSLLRKRKNAVYSFT